jgi:hypothetical protein
MHASLIIAEEYLDGLTTHYTAVLVLVNTAPSKIVQHCTVLATIQGHFSLVAMVSYETQKILGKEVVELE